MVHILQVTSNLKFQKKVTENVPSSVTKKAETPKPKEKSSNDGKSKGTGLFGWVKGKLGVKDDQIHMGDKLRYSLIKFLWSIKLRNFKAKH